MSIVNEPLNEQRESTAAAAGACGQIDDDQLRQEIAPGLRTVLRTRVLAWIRCRRLAAGRNRRASRASRARTGDGRRELA